MELALNQTVHGFTVISKETLREIEGEAIVCRHEPSGARLLYLKNDDNNKSFAIGFRTPPRDDTGVFHILEHSVLCGSRRFPVKEPFVDLLKGSMQTFLNAMTFPDKTLYPVASTNDQDLENLMDVYLDAVFHPRIYEKRAIFEQEGWHYELVGAEDATVAGAGDPARAGANAADEALVYNGVVFNEMKGALSDATSVLFNDVQSALLPDTPYAFESGGTPQGIPTLTYEKYLDEHRRHYRTDNSYIVLYGNLDADRALAFLDERYLTPVFHEQQECDDARTANGLEPLVARTLPLQAPVAAGFKSRTMDTAPENACAASGYVIGTAADHVRVVATDILLDALFGSNEAPLKRALLDAGVAHDISAFVVDAILQPFAVVQLSMPAQGSGENLQAIVADHVRRLLDGGLDHTLLEAALSHAEFVMREHEFGIADGVVLAMSALSGWLYDDDAACDYLRYEDAYAKLRAELENGYFEKLCREIFLENGHTATCEVVPTPGKSDDDSPARLAEKLAAMTAEERAAVREEEAALRAMQEAPDTPEAIATLPRLSVADIQDAPAEPAYGLDENAPVPCLRHSMTTHGIVYAYRYFDESRLGFDDVPYVSVLALVLGKLDTAHHTAAQLDTLAQDKLGNLTFFSQTFEREANPDVLFPKFVVSASALAKNVEALAEIPREVLTETDFSNTAKILDILKQRKIEMEQIFTNNGHQCAAARMRSYYSRSGVLADARGNVAFYRFLCDLVDNFDARADELVQRLDDLAKRLFADNGCIMSFAGPDDAYERFWQAEPACGRTSDDAARMEVPEPHVRNEAFVTPSDVCYAAIGWDMRLFGDSYDGTWAVAARALSLDYLWNEVRVKGGAYGVGMRVGKFGTMRLHSYRDPHLDETLARFAEAADWLRAYEPSPEDLAGFIVSTVAGIDAPTKPRALIRRQAADFFMARTDADRQRIRSEVIACDIAAVRSHADTLARAVGQGARCVFGNRTILESSQADFELVELFGAIEEEKE